MPEPEQLARFYDQYHLSDDEGGCYDWVEARMKSDFPARIALVKRIKEGGVGRLLDVGCGKGFFVHACSESGIEAEGIDLSASAIDHATGTLGVRAACGDLADFREQFADAFDTVTFWATIEHLPDPIGMLRDIHAALRPGGHLVVTTGLGNDWLDRLLPGRVQWYIPPEHLFVFSDAGLRHAVEAAGFTVCLVDTNFERSLVRRLIKFVRNGAAALAFRAAAELCRVRDGGFVGCRFPLGNRIALVARKS